MFILVGIVLENFIVISEVEVCAAVKLYCGILRAICNVLSITYIYIERERDGGAAAAQTGAS